METTSQQPAPPPCQCDQQLGGALPWLVAVGLVLLAFNLWRERRRKKREGKRTETASGGHEDGGER